MVQLVRYVSVIQVCFIIYSILYFQCWSQIYNLLQKWLHMKRNICTSVKCILLTTSSLSVSQTGLCLSYLPLCKAVDRDYLCASFFAWDHASQDNSQGEDTTTLEKKSFIICSLYTGMSGFCFPWSMTAIVALV